MEGRPSRRVTSRPSSRLLGEGAHEVFVADPAADADVAGHVGEDGEQAEHGQHGQ